MMMSSSGRTRFPFTASQWQELEHQALVFKYMVSGMPIPPDLLFTIRRSLDSSLSSKFLIHQPQHIGWNGFQMGFGRKIDPEPGRCRRTDGKKWRCSKEAYPDSKYCERHMHRGRNRSRKPVEILSPKPANPIPINNNNNNNNNTSSTTSTVAAPESHFLNNYHPHLSSSRPPGFGFSSSSSSHDNTNFFLESHVHSRPPPPKDFRNSGGDEQLFFSGTDSNSGTILRNICGDSTASKLTLMGSSQSTTSQIKQQVNACSCDDNHLTTYGQHAHDHHHHHHHYSSCERDEQPKKVMHHFLDEWPPKDRDSHEDKMPTHRTTQLSISIPNSLHDFFMTQKW